MNLAGVPRDTPSAHGRLGYDRSVKERRRLLLGLDTGGHGAGGGISVHGRARTIPERGRGRRGPRRRTAAAALEPGAGAASVRRANSSPSGMEYAHGRGIVRVTRSNHEEVIRPQSARSPEIRKSVRVEHPLPRECLHRCDWPRRFHSPRTDGRTVRRHTK